VQTGEHTENTCHWCSNYKDNKINSPSICLVVEKLGAKPVMPDPRWPPADTLLGYFICAIDWADAEFENIAAIPQQQDTCD